MTNFEPSTVSMAAELIRASNPKLAALFIARPFHRVTIAQAFAKGLRNDPMEMGLTIIALAELDRDDRMEYYKSAAR